jgi:hypothetical protein
MIPFPNVDTFFHETCLDNFIRGETQPFFPEAERSGLAFLRDCGDEKLRYCLRHGHHGGDLLLHRSFILDVGVHDASEFCMMGASEKLSTQLPPSSQ